MKPCSRKAMPSSTLMQNVGFGDKNTVASIKGTTKKLGVNYRNATVVLYNNANLQTIAIRKPNENGDYIISGLNNSLSCFIIAFDNNKQYNAVVQDGVVPK